MAPPTDPGQLAGSLLRERLRIVLVRPQHPGNVGACARAMMNMGLRQLTIVDPPVLDMERARWMATSGRSILAGARFTATVAEAVADCHWAVACTARSRRWRWPVLSDRELAARAFEAGEGRTAILFGQEDTGLDNEAISHCQAIVKISTDGAASLNLAQAVLLISSRLHDEARARGWTSDTPRRQGRRSGGPTGSPPGPPPAEPTAPLSRQAEVVGLALDVLAATPYMNGKTPDQVQVLLSSLLQRAHPTQAELDILKGMLKKTRWKLGSPRP